MHWCYLTQNPSLKNTIWLFEKTLFTCSENILKIWHRNHLGRKCLVLTSHEMTQLATASHLSGNTHLNSEVKGESSLHLSSTISFLRHRSHGHRSLGEPRKDLTASWNRQYNSNNITWELNAYKGNLTCLLRMPSKAKFAQIINTTQNINIRQEKNRKLKKKQEYV